MPSVRLTCHLRRLRDDERGAITVDWVALTAAIMLVGLAVSWLIMEEGVDPLAGRTVDALSSAELTSVPPPPVIGDGN